jgi:hypothetical protein
MMEERMEDKLNQVAAITGIMPGFDVEVFTAMLRDAQPNHNSGKNYSWFHVDDASGIYCVTLFLPYEVGACAAYETGEVANEPGRVICGALVAYGRYRGWPGEWRLVKGRPELRVPYEA